jgi:predicted RNase H-like nuclease
VSPARSSAGQARRVGGLDGCPAGWVLATTVLTTAGHVTPDQAEVRLVPTFAEALALVLDGTLDALGIDMPIGLPDAGPRQADRAARLRLGTRRASVFATPVRAVLGAVDYRDALVRSRSVDGRGLSKQAYNLLPRIAEVDAAMTPDLQDRVFECHPETCFARLAGQPLTTVKRDPEGRADRDSLLTPVLGDVRSLWLTPPPGARADDVLDALAILTTAARVVAGSATRLGDGSLDGTGLRMEIVV